MVKKQLCDRLSCIKKSSVEVKYEHIFELMFGYTWWAICHTAYNDNSHAQVNSCCILFEYSLMHAHEITSGTRVFIQNVPASVF